MVVYQDDKVAYIGQTKNDQFHGEGTIYYYESGDLFQGNFMNGLKNGHGNIHYYNGDKYVGNFFKDEIHGVGKYISGNGYIYEGNFIFGNLFGSGKMYNMNLDLVYNGEFHNSLPHGFGISYLDNKLKYIGNWKQNLYHGYGVLVENDVNNYGKFHEGTLIEKVPKIPHYEQQIFNFKKQKPQPVKNNDYIALKTQEEDIKKQFFNNNYTPNFLKPVNINPPVFVSNPLIMLSPINGNGNESKIAHNPTNVRPKN